MAMEEGGSHEQGLKILANNQEVGSLLGPGGHTLKALREKVGCKIFISEKPYPLMDIRCIYILGKKVNIIECQKFILSVFAKVRELTMHSRGSDPAPSSLRSSHTMKITWDGDTDTYEKYDSVELELKLVVPLQCTNLILGESLEDLKRVSRVESVFEVPCAGAKDTSKLTMEKVLTINASCSRCAIFTAEVVKLMATNRDISAYLYGSNFSSSVMMATSHRRNRISRPKKHVGKEAGGLVYHRAGRQTYYQATQPYRDGLNRMPISHRDGGDHDYFSTRHHTGYNISGSNSSMVPVERPIPDLSLPTLLPHGPPHSSTQAHAQDEGFMMQSLAGSSYQPDVFRADPFYDIFSTEREPSVFREFGGYQNPRKFDDQHQQQQWHEHSNMKES